MAARGGPETPQAKAAKYAKVLNKIKKEYLGDCKKVQRISQRIQRYNSMKNPLEADFKFFGPFRSFATNFACLCQKIKI